MANSRVAGVKAVNLVWDLPALQEAIATEPDQWRVIYRQRKPLGKLW